MILTVSRDPSPLCEWRKDIVCEPCFCVTTAGCKLISWTLGAADASIRRTASLDALYTRPTWSLGHVSTVLHLDKATQTDESYIEKQKSSGEWSFAKGSDTASSSPDIKIEKVIRQRWQRVQRGEHSVSSQTLSPAHGNS